MPRFKVLITDYPWGDLTLEREILDRVDAELVACRAADGQETQLAAMAADADALLTTWVRLTRRVLVAARHCRVVSRMGIGLDNIDVAYCTERGIPVTNVPDYCTEEVAEHALALLLALARHVAEFHRQTKQGRYELTAAPPLHRVAGRTLGIVGLGRTGAALARKARGLDLRLLGCSNTRREVSGVAWCDLNTLLERSDFVSLHTPLTPETRGLIGAAQLARMKPSAFLINTARGDLVDHEALAAALAADRLAGAALDVQSPEPPDLTKPPYNDPRVVVTPHAAFVSEEALATLRREACENVVAVLQGRRPPHVVNPAVFD